MGCVSCVATATAQLPKETLSPFLNFEIVIHAPARLPTKSAHIQVLCRKNDKRKSYELYKVIEVTPPPTSLGTRSFPSNMHCGESITIEDKPYIISSVTHRYQLRRGKYEPSERRLDVQSAGRYLVNKFLENLLEES